MASHPSLAVVPPSSQYPAKGIITFASPQTSLQTLGVEESPAVQLNSVSSLQEESHPSPSITFPSSQYPATTLITIPSPQISDQVLAVDESPKVQEYPSSTAQLASHPSPAVVPASSQYPAVGLMTTPSPQVSSQTLAVEELPGVQECPVSTAQLESQPSPSIKFPSSQ